MLDNELWALCPTILVHIEPKSELHITTITRPALIERDGIDDTFATGGTDAQLEMILPDNPLFEDRKVTTPHRLGKSGAPGPGIA